MKNSIKYGIILLFVAICSTLSLNLIGMRVVETKESNAGFLNTELLKEVNNNYSAVYKSLTTFFNTYYKLYDVCFPLTDRIVCGRQNLPPEIKRYKGQKREGYTVGFPLNYSTILEPNKPCEGSDNIIIGISGGPFNYLRRIVYRHIYRSYKVLFFVARSHNETTNQLVKEENDIFNDIIQFEFYASYYNLTAQTMHEMRWINDHCSNYIYYMHQSDDTFYNVRLFKHKFLDDNNGKLIHDVIGYRWVGNIAIHRNNSIFYVPVDIWPSPTYPPQPSGPGYILSKNVIPIVANATFYMEKTILFEDAYMGIIFDFIKVNITPINKYVNPFFSDKDKSGKDYARKTIFIHTLNPFEMYLLSQLVM